MIDKDTETLGWREAGIKPKTKNIILFLLQAVLCFCVFVPLCYSQEIVIVYTGETHAMLYPCDCPIEPDGGIARRATLIKQFRKDNPAALILDSGGFFAGGIMDAHTQNSELDKKRTLVNLKAIELMGYDALAIGDDEFNFGKAFLQENAAKTKLHFLSSNIVSNALASSNAESKTLQKSFLNKISPYIIKEVSGVKIGILGLTPLIAQTKSEDLKIIEPAIALNNIVKELKREKKTDIIMLLSHQGEDDDLKLIKEVEGIDIVLTGHSRSKEEPFTKINSTLILRPSWQGRRLGKLTLTLKDKKITDYKVEELRLSDKIADDPGIISILPKCFSNSDCKKDGLAGECENPSLLNSQCIFQKAPEVPLLIITAKSCKVCNPEPVINSLKTLFPGLVVSYLYYPDAKADRLVGEFGIDALPFYLLGKEAEKEGSFNKFKDNLERKGDFYLLKTQFTGISYFLKRKRIKGNLDLFLSLYDKDAAKLLEMMKDFKPNVHFLTVEKGEKFEAAKGIFEAEEYLRSVCVEKYYPDAFWNYIVCRAANINSSWWDDCLNKLDADRIKVCSRGQEGRGLLRKNIGLNKELQIMFGPVYLLDNQEIFSFKGAPPKDDLKKILGRD